MKNQKSSKKDIDTLNASFEKALSEKELIKVMPACCVG